MQFAALAFRIVILAALVVCALVIQGHGRCASLWQRTAALGAAGLLGLGGSLFPLLVFGAGWVVTSTTVAAGALSAAVAIQAARAAEVRPTIQLLLGTCAAALGVASALQPLTIY
jgi:hypothetical protein